MPFGLKIAAQTLTFQCFIDEVLRRPPFVFAYINDLLIASKDAAEHQDRLMQVFKPLNDYGIQINVVCMEFRLMIFLATQFLQKVSLHFLPNVRPFNSFLSQLQPYKRGQSVALAWSPEADIAYDAVKQVLSAITTLNFPSQDAPTVLHY
ncbi:uncharacterized protein LOC119583332 [Penaeus monodon]|uniref:uncharacterized protein LOC119583332 n=1 Tax=Penaeus monodon TaxID=6687 RepID=UPI0018A73E81|nr:uncharacterized protein LOC119583332 [Penaeus monodon]